MRFHGGDKEARIDFSSNTNPLGPPPALLDALVLCSDINTLRSYPDYSYAELRKAVARFYGAHYECIVPTNGAAEALNLAVLAAKPRRIVTIEPSYGEYEMLAKVLELEHLTLQYRVEGSKFYMDLRDLKNVCNDAGTLVVVVNPNNPTGSYIHAAELLSELGDCSARVLVDEAYVELCTQCPLEVPHNLPENFIIVRSLTKWLAVPGLRLGFAYIKDGELLRKMEALRQPWNVNAIAECVAVKVLKLKGELERFIEMTRRYIELERARVSKGLRALGLRVFESVTNFLLIDLGAHGDSVVSTLRARGLAVRSCKSFKGLGPNYIRVALRGAGENDELIAALGEVVRNVREGHQPR